MLVDFLAAKAGVSAEAAVPAHCTSTSTVATSTRTLVGSPRLPAGNLNLVFSLLDVHTRLLAEELY